MVNLDWSQCHAVESAPGRLSGAWVFRDTRMPVSAVFENIEAGASQEEIVDQFDITREQINAVLEFAARSLDAPRGVARSLQGHTVIKAKDRGWDRLANGDLDLLAEAERGGCDLLVTADENMSYQQNLSGRRIALVVLSTPQWPIVKLHPDEIAAAVNACTPGSFTQVQIPYK
jgi:uncharacterized protein (DUF433 family)